MRIIFKPLLKAFGWTLIGEQPPHKKCVYIFAPHTSNWDFVIMMMARFCFKMKPAYLGKHTLFKPPFGWFFRMLGGIPVERSSTNNVVDQVAKIFEQRENVHLALAPEGTRSKTNKWKSGFYHITLKAGVPLGLAFLDTKTKTLGIARYIELTGNLDDDMQAIRDFYKDKIGFKPELTSDIRLEVKDS